VALYQYRFEQVRLLLVEPNTEIRQGLLAALRDYGFRNVATATSEAKVKETLQSSEIDLIIGDSHYDGDSVCAAVKNMRHSKLGENPFTVSIALCSEPLAKNIKTAVDAGFDDVIAKPAPVNKIVSRISRQISDRRKFVVAHTYVGPDRRKNPRDDDDGRVQIPLLEVPNPLKAIAEDGMTHKQIKDQILSARYVIKDRWLLRSAEQLDIFAQQLASHYIYSDAPDKIPMLVRYLDAMSHELHNRLEGARKVAASELCVSTIDVTERMAADPKNIQSKDIELLPNLTKAIVKAFEKDPSKDEVVHDITRSVLNAAGE